MNPNEEHILYLITQKLAGEADDTELQELEQLINENPRASQLWEEVLAFNSQEDIQNNFRRIDNWNWQDTAQMRARVRRKSRQKVFVGLTLAAIALIGIFISVRMFRIEQHQSVAVLVKNEKIIELQLANGKVINLSQVNDSLQLGNTILSNTNKTLSYSLQAGDNTGYSNTMNSLKVPVGMDYHLELSDGSNIWLNSATQLKFPFQFNQATREISVNGEAYMEIAKDANRPFLVHTPQGTVKVLGTSFNVNSYDSGTVRVALVEGLVHLQTAAAETKIKPGFEAVYQNRDISLNQFDADEVLAWRSGRYYFNEATFAEIMQVLPRWYGIDVKFDNSKIRTHHFTGVINRNKPVSVFLEKLRKAMDLEYYFDNQQVLHIK